MGKKIGKLVIYLLLSSLVIIGLLEGSLRMLGYRPFESINGVNYTNHSAFDQDLGWKLLPGHYEIGPFNDIGDSMSITIKKDTGRVTRINNLGVGDEKIIFIGGSFIMGHALDDDETMAWKIQQRFPRMDIRNLGVSGYGTLQALIMLENELKKGNKPKCVIYGAFQHHELRNVAQGDWLMELGEKKVPYLILINDSTFERKGLIGMHSLQLTDRLASAYLAERTLNRFLSYKRVKDSKKLFSLIIQEMQRTCSEYQVSFYVVPLSYPQDEMNDLVTFLKDKGIKYIDCNVSLSPDNIIKDDGHPGESVNDIWVERIAKRLIQDGITHEPLL